MAVPENDWSRKPVKAWLIPALIVAALALGGCGYVMTSSLDDNPARTVVFSTVENQLYPPRPGLEYSLTRRLKDEISLDRRLELVADHGHMLLKVSLVAFDEPTIVKNLETTLPSEIMLRATVVVKASGEGVPGGSVVRRLSASDGYAPALGESRDEALNRLCRDLSRQIIDAATDREWAQAESE